ncbi:MAG: IS1182 family transposase [Oscillospiraceae bacterium]|nr:IS1182 family transposase [Oscillospiraceae bacterium]
MNKNQMQLDYTPYAGEYQLKLPLETEILIAKNDPVRLLSAMVKRMNMEKILRSYSHNGRHEYSPRILLKVLVYAYMRRIYSTREIERACRENVNFMYLLEGNAPPDHNTIHRFRSKRLAGREKDLLEQQVAMLQSMGVLSMETVFIDGTKIEANANRYSFRWKKNAIRSGEKLVQKIRAALPELVKTTGVKWHIPEQIKLHKVKKLRKRLYEKAQQLGLEFVHGKGKHKHPLQRAIETVEGWLQKLKQYTQDIYICGSRNSYSKTDNDATFMHMKEDHMRNGQLKPGYNVNVACSEEFIIGNYISSDRNDVHTLIPFMEYLKRHSAIRRVCVDAGYESEENYCYFERAEQELFVKPSNHEAKKSRKYKSDISRRENMAYNKEQDTYTCAAGKALTLDHVKKEKTASGFETEKSVYSCKECSGCPLKEKCILAKGSKKPLEERSKVIYVSKRFAEQREAMEEKINTERGKLIRVNRSIQAEGVFAMVKEDMNFRRFMLRGTVKVEVEWTLLSLAYNLLKLHHKAQSNRLGTGLVVPKRFPAGL